MAIVINEVLFDPATGVIGDANADGIRDPFQDEFVEIVNTGPGLQDLSGWTLGDDDTMADFIFPVGTILAENKALVLFGGGVPTGSFGDAQVFVDDGRVGNGLANDGDLVELRDESDALIASVGYGNAGSVMGGSGESVTRNPDITGSFVDHSQVSGTLFSPGTQVDGSPFVGTAVITDNGDVGYTSTGFHAIPDALFPDPEGRGGDIENSQKGTGADTATWTFSGLTAGTYRVSATWSTHQNRATNAPYSIIDDATGTLLVRTLVNQELQPGDFMDDGSSWQDLGIVTITGDALTVQLSDAADEYVIADAVRVERAAEAPPAGPLYVDDGDAAYADTGWHASPVLEGRLNGIRYQSRGDGSQTAKWAFAGLGPGNYTVSATWSAHSNRATNAPYTIRDGAAGDTLEIVRVNQQMAPDDFTDNGSGWEHLTTVAITGSQLVVQLSNDANGFVIADAIRIEPTTIAPPPAGTIIDDGDVGFLSTAGWFESLTEGRGGDVRYTGLGDGTRVATWTFTGLTPGRYRVSATWSAHANRATNAPYTIFDTVTPLGTVEVNQQQAPDDFSTLGSDWEDLMTVDITDEVLVVTLSNNANGFLIADAIRIQPQPLVAPISVLAWNVESGGNDPNVIAGQLSALAGYDIYALSEVGQNDAMPYDDALGEGFNHVLSATGRGDRLQVIYDEQRFELLDARELDTYGGFRLNDGDHRSPLVLILRDRASDVVFQVMANHLARADEALRNEQAMALREWGRDQALPTVTIGDFNMDFEFATEMGNDAFTEMLRDNVWQWVRPEELIDTNWADSDGDGMDDFPDSMLDFAFVAGPSKDWKPVSNVIVREGDFPDDETTSDHRPIELLLAP